MASNAKKRCLSSSLCTAFDSSKHELLKAHVDWPLATYVRIPSLTDLCAKKVAETFTFQDVEERLHPVPEPLQRKIVFYAFPRNEQDIKLYSSSYSTLQSSCDGNNNNINNSRQPFSVAQNLIETDGVRDVLQIGFHLSGVIHETHGICHQKRIKQYAVSMSFDRCKITSVSCNCSNGNLFWCHHVVALALYRLHHSEDVPIHVPISETILKLDKRQLQKVLLQLVAKHENFILPSVQNALDDICDAESEISKMNGLPDPTAGACTGTYNRWYLNSEHIKKEIHAGLCQGNTGKSISTIFNKIYELCSVNDNNAHDLLTLVTEVFMEHSFKHNELSNESSTSHEKVMRLLDTLCSLWVSVMKMSDSTERNIIREQLIEWRKQPTCPLIATPKRAADGLYHTQTVFDLPLDAVEWCSALDGPLVQSAAQVEAYRCYGYRKEALHQAVKVAQHISSSFDQLSCNVNEAAHGGWLGHTLDPISSVFDLLFQEGLTNNNEYLPMAVKVALYAMMQDKYIPLKKYSQMRICHREEQLIAQLDQLDFTTEPLKSVLLECSQTFLEYLNVSSKRSDIFPFHAFTRFIFSKLLPHNSSLAYQIAVSSLPLFGNTTTNTRQSLLAMCCILPHIESQQNELAACMLSSCREALHFLPICQTEILQSIKDPSRLFHLAKLIDYYSVDDTCSTATMSFQQVAFQFGIEVVSNPSSLHFVGRNDAVRWLVTCASNIGQSTVEYLINHWAKHFTVKEFVKEVSPLLTSQPIITQLHMSKKELNVFMGKLKQVAIECCIQAPDTCALYALTLCEGDPDGFDLICQIVKESSYRLKSTYLFHIARYLDSKGHPGKAFKIATFALKQLDIAADDNNDSHPAVCDILWTCVLACSRNQSDLATITPILLATVQDPVLLSEIAARCVTTRRTHHTSNPKSICDYRSKPISDIVERSIQLYSTGIQQRLNSITPKMYGSFISYLDKAKADFKNANQGLDRFKSLKDDIVRTQRGKRKLLRLVMDSV